jgi:LTXXQ motif family protein
MTGRTGFLVAMLAVFLTAAIPLGAGAQDQKKVQQKAAPARPAVHHAPRAAPHPQAARPAVRVAPHPQAIRRARQPHPAARAVHPHPAMRRATASQPRPRQSVAPRQTTAPAIRQATQKPAQRQKHLERRARQKSAAPKIITRTTPQKSIQQALPKIQQPNVQQQKQVTTRQQLRAERALRRREDNALRHLPANQRARRREDIRHARQLRAQQRIQSRPNAQTTLQAPPNAAAQPNAQARRNWHHNRNRNARLTPQQARQGRFAAPFRAGAQTFNSGRRANARFANFAARRAWHHGRRARFVPWYGPVFWPYAYSDIFDYAFWPGGYDDGYWAYVYDDFVDGLFWGEVGPPNEYVYAEPHAAPAAPSVRYAAVEELCKQPGTGITAWPFAEIERKVGLDREQRRLLGEMRDAAKRAATEFKRSCPSEDIFPLTPPGRLQAMAARLEATLVSVQAVHPALEKFYDSLSDEQKARFNDIGPKRTANSAEASQALPREARTCKEAKPGLTNLPIEKINDIVKPNETQSDSLDRLAEVTVKAVAILQAACPDETPITPTGRLEAMEKRLQAMIDAANTVRPALDSFYASLSNEQKARFNRIGRQLAQENG